MKRGIWPFKQSWYSICSRHQEHDESCNLCKSGWWRYDMSAYVEKIVFKIFPSLWRWWTNR